MKWRMNLTIEGKTYRLIKYSNLSEIIKLLLRGYRFHKTMGGWVMKKIGGMR